MGIPAGWYQDLDDAARLRWWDGDAWTSATRGREALDGPPTGPSERLSGSGGGGPRPDPDVDGREARVVTGPAGATPPDSSHLTAASAAAAAAEVAARLAASTPLRAEGEPTLRPEGDAPRATRTVRIDDRELGHLLDVVPEVPPHLLPIPAERRSRMPRAFRDDARSGGRDAGRGDDRPQERAAAHGAEPSSRTRTSEAPEGEGAVPVPHITLTSLGRSARRARPTVRIDGRAPRAPLGRRAALRRTFATGGAVALVVVLAVGFLLDDVPPPQSAAPDAGATRDVDPLLDEIPVVPELGAPGADGGPEGEAEAVQRVLVPLGGPCGTVEVALTGGREASTLRAWDASECTLAPVALEAGEQRWIVVRASLNGAAATEASARASAERAGADGLLWSGYYASLNPDLWVVFDGPFASRAQAEAAARAVGGGAYERVLSDDETDRYCIAPGGCTGGVPRD